MAFEDVPTDVPDNTEDDAHFRVGATGVVSRTFTLWTRRLVHYVMVTGVILTLYYAVSLVTVWIVLGPSYLTLANVIDNNPLSVMFKALGVILDPTQLIIAVLSLVGLLISNIANAAAIKLAYDDYGNPGAGTVGDSISTAVSRLVKVIAIGLIEALIMIPFILPFIIVGLYFISAGPINPYDPAFFQLMQQMIALIFASFIVILIGVYVMIRLTPALVIGVVEDKGAMDSVKHAFRLTKGQFWHVFGSFIIVIIALFVVGLVIGTVIMFITPGYIALNVLSAIISLLFLSSIMPIFQTVLYKDLVVRYKIETSQEYW